MFEHMSRNCDEPLLRQNTPAGGMVPLAMDNPGLAHSVQSDFLGCYCGEHPRSLESIAFICSWAEREAALEDHMMLHARRVIKIGATVALIMYLD